MIGRWSVIVGRRLLWTLQDSILDAVLAFLHTLSILVHLPPCLASNVGMPLGSAISSLMLLIRSRRGLSSLSGLARCAFTFPSHAGWCLLTSPSKIRSVVGVGRKLLSCSYQASLSI